MGCIILEIQEQEIGSVKEYIQTNVSRKRGIIAKLQKNASIQIQCFFNSYLDGW